MEIWRKIQIANVVLAVVAVALSVASIYQPNLAGVAMWAWSFTLMVFMFLVPMPIIERNKRNNRIGLVVAFLLAVLLAVLTNTWVSQYPETAGFSRSFLVYMAAYTIVALLFAAWLKIKEKRNK